MNILVVDDEADTRRLLRDLLMRASHSVTLASDATEATAHLGLMKYDLILLDFMMPGVDGYQFSQYLATHWRTFDVPVLVVSCKSDSASTSWAKIQGCVGYIVKPFSPAELLDKVAEVRGLRTYPGRPREPRRVENRASPGTRRRPNLDEVVDDE